VFGFLNVNKPKDVTSRDIVNHVQRIVRPVKVGHAGTLDPLATGVLVLALGPATRLIEYAQQSRKRYRGEFLLGRESDSEDLEGTVRELPHPPRPVREEIEAVLPRFFGRIEQRPPAFSALKVAGRRAYDLAREGKAVDLAPRPVDVYELTLVDYDYPQMTLEVVCGAGTYIRSLGRDIAEALGTAAVMSALVRTAVGEFQIVDACELESLSRESIKANLEPPLKALGDMPQVRLGSDQLHRIARGMPVSFAGFDPKREVAVVDDQSRLRAILKSRRDGWGPSRNFAVNEEE
jgi:tRNA pseudouridine55 synthase